jgi:hypothetical protein
LIVERKVQEAKGNPHCRRLSLRRKKNARLATWNNPIFLHLCRWNSRRRSGAKLTGEVVDKPATRQNIFLRNPSISAEMLSSSWKAERESVFQAFRIFPSVSLSLPWLLVKQPFEARSMWHHHLCPSPEEGTRCCFFLCGRKKGHHRTELPLLKLSLRTFFSTRFFGGFAKAKTLLKEVSSSFSDPLTPSQTTPYYNCT